MPHLLWRPLRSAIGALTLLVGCGRLAPLVFEESRLEYLYTAYGRSGTALAAGVLVLPEWRGGDGAFRGAWEVVATGPSEDVSGSDLAFQDGRGRLTGSVQSGLVTIHFHPETLGGDREFTLTGSLAKRGAEGSWGFATEGGWFPRRGTFTLIRKE
jgi:hypothetical protein